MPGFLISPKGSITAPSYQGFPEGFKRADVSPMHAPAHEVEPQGQLALYYLFRILHLLNLGQTME